MTESTSSPTVLVIDDSLLVLDIIQERLEDAGFRAVPAHTAFEGFLAMVKEDPDLVLLDLGMPGMDGEMLMEIVQTARERDGTCTCPVVLHSERQEQVLKDVMHRTGANGFIRKTSDSEHFIAQVQAWLAQDTKAA